MKSKLLFSDKHARKINEVLSYRSAKAGIRRKVYLLKIRKSEFRCSSRGLIMTKYWNPRNDAPFSPEIIWNLKDG